MKKNHKRKKNQNYKRRVAVAPLALALTASGMLAGCGQQQVVVPQADKLIQQAIVEPTPEITPEPLAVLTPEARTAQLSAAITPITADEPDDTIKVKVDGQTVQWVDTLPFIDNNNRTLVPLRAVGEAMGLVVDWDSANQEAVFTDWSNTIYFGIGKSEARVQTVSTGTGIVEMDTAAAIKDGRTFAPIRYLANFFGYEVSWDGETQTISLSKTASPGELVTVSAPAQAPANNGNNGGNNDGGTQPQQPSGDAPTDWDGNPIVAGGNISQGFVDWVADAQENNQWDGGVDCTGDITVQGAGMVDG